MHLSTKAAPAPVDHVIPCVHCGARARLDRALFVYVANDAAPGARKLMWVSGGFYFCSADCRARWWETPTTETLLTEVLPAGAAHATILHHNGDCEACLIVETADGLGLAVVHGEPQAHHRFAGGQPVLEAWWRGDLEVPAEPPPWETGKGSGDQ